MRLLFFLVSFLPAPGIADTFVADAFGLTSASHVDEVRSEWSDQGQPEHTSAYRSPGEPDRVLLIVGPKSMVAGKDRVHAVAIVLDAHGNHVADGTMVALRIGTETVRTTTQAGIADHLLMPAPIAREITFGAEAGQTQSARAMVRVVSDLGSVKPDLRGAETDARYEAFFTIKAKGLTDRFGNMAEDGSAVTFLLEDENGHHSMATATVIDGVAHGRFLSRDIDGPMRSKASLGGNSSNEARVTIASPIPAGLPDVLIEPLPAVGALRMIIGPFLTASGHALGDGATVLVEASDDRGTAHQNSAWVRDGSVVVTFPIEGIENLAQLTVSSPLGLMDLRGRWVEATRVEVME